MFDAAEAAQIEEPLIIFAVQALFLHQRKQHIHALLTLRAANQLTDARHQHIGRRHGFAVVVQAHIEAFNLLRVVGDEHGLFINLLGQIALMLGLQVHAPLHRILEFGVILLQNFYCLGIADTRKVVAYHIVQLIEQFLIEKAVEKFQLVAAMLHHIADDAFNHRLGAVHIVAQVGKRQLRLNHPELGGMARRVGVFGAEGGAEGVHVAHSGCHRLGFQLAGHGQIGAAAKEVLRKVHFSIFGAGDVVKIHCGDAEHLTRALAVGTRDNGRVNINKALLLEKLVDGIGGGTAHAERCTKGIRASAQVRHSAQKLHGVALFLQRIIAGASAKHFHAVGVDFQRLLCLRRQHDNAFHAQAGADACFGNLFIILQLLRFKHHLKRRKARAVGKLDKADVFGIADGFCPAAYGDGFAALEAAAQ